MNKKLKSVLILIFFVCRCGFGVVCNHKGVKTSSFDVYAAEEHKEGNIGRIYNGFGAFHGQFNYMAYLQIWRLSNSTMYRNICGGTLIADKWVLTAAHCVDQGSNVAIEVFLGTIYIENAEASYILDRSKITKHPGWNKETRTHDMALLAIPQTAYCHFVGAISMPHSDLDPLRFEPGIPITFGWGNTGNTPSKPDRLQWTTVRLISNLLCREAFPDVAANEICVATNWPNGAPCKGDSGGPLVLNGVLIGVLSSNSGEGCEDGRPALYMRVTYYLPWITSVTGIEF